LSWLANYFLYEIYEKDQNQWISFNDAINDHTKLYMFPATSTVSLFLTS
jgi:hypothetical protein